MSLGPRSRHKQWLTVAEWIEAVVHNVWPAGHIRPSTGPRVARGVQQEK